MILHCAADKRKDKALAAMPSRGTSDKSGHRRKAFLLSDAHKSRSKSSAANAASNNDSPHKTLRTSRTSRETSICRRASLPNP